MKRLVLLFCAFGLLAATAGSFDRSGRAQDATPAPGEFAIAPGVVAYDAVFAQGEEDPRTYRLRLDPGTVYPFEAAPSLDLVHVDSGAATLRLDAATTVHRSGFPGENLAAGTEFTAVAGDYFVLAPRTGGEVRNTGSEPLVFSVASLVPSASDAATPEA